MQAIQAPIRPTQTGPEVANLQDALLAFLEQSDHKIIAPLISPNRPTRDQLRRLTQGLRVEHSESQFLSSTQELVFYFHLQQSLGDHRRDVGVEETTALKLNEWLRILRLIDIVETNGFFVRGTVTSADDQPLSGAIVRAFDRSVESIERLPVG